MPGMGEDERYIICTETSEKAFSDIAEANQFLEQAEKPTKITQVIWGAAHADVNLATGSISVDGKEIDLGISKDRMKELSDLGLRWVNFNLCEVTYGMSGGRSPISKSYVVGWQATDKNGKNIQRRVIVERDGKWELIKKGF